MRMHHHHFESRHHLFFDGVDAFIRCNGRSRRRRDESVHSLRHALRAHPWASAEARRVAAIPARTIKEIVDGTPDD